MNINKNFIIGFILLFFLCVIFSFCYMYFERTSIVNYFQQKPVKPVKPEKPESINMTETTEPIYDQLTSNNNIYKLVSGSSNNLISLGNYMLSPNMMYQLVFKKDGDLVLYDLTSPSGTPISVWSTKTMNTRSNIVILNSNGILEINRINGIDNKNIWSSSNKNTNNSSGPYNLVLQNDRNLVIYDANSNIVWSSNTALSAPEMNNPPVNNIAEENAPVINNPEVMPEVIHELEQELEQELEPEVRQMPIPSDKKYTILDLLDSSSPDTSKLLYYNSLVSPNGLYTLGIYYYNQQSSDFTTSVLRIHPTGNIQNILQSLSFPNVIPDRLSITPDGNLEFYGWTNDPMRLELVWQTNTKNLGKAPYKLMLQDDGILVIRDSDQNIIWKSNTK